MKLLHDLFKESDEQTVFQLFEEYYPEEIKNIDGYKKVYNQLKNCDCFSIPKDMYTIHIALVDEPDNCYYDFFGMIKDSDTKWGLDFQPWNEIIQYLVVIEEDIVSHNGAVAIALFDMTFYGFTEAKIASIAEEINSGVDDIKEIYNL